MNEEEIKKAYIKLELEKYGFWGFDTAKKKLLTYNLIAYFKKKRIKLVKIIGNKCIVKIITQKGLDTSRFSIDANYNDDLEHKNGKIKIIDFEIV